MQYIAASQLRTQTPDLIAALKEGKSVDLIHRSQVVGTIVPPKQEPKKKKLSMKEFIQQLGKVKLDDDRDIKEIYRERLMEKYA
jgi:antitoxin (DNA-binding transcriptional repressor) of toxin-antitoxin stability system